MRNRIQERVGGLVFSSDGVGVGEPGDRMKSDQQCAKPEAACLKNKNHISM